MSYCAIVTFKNDKPDMEAKFGNAFAGCLRVWKSLAEEYLPDFNIFFSNDREFWDLAKRKDLQLFKRAVHAATFDRAIIRQEHFKLYAQHLRQFEEVYPNETVGSHLVSWAKYIESCEAEAIGFVGTSVTGSLWFDYDDEKNESIPYDLKVGKDHFEVYDWLNEIDTED